MELCAELPATDWTTREVVHADEGGNDQAIEAAQTTVALTSSGIFLRILL